MTSTEASGPDKLSPGRRTAIEQAIKKVAWQHLKAPDAETALAFYATDAVVAADGRLYSSFETFAEQARDFYRTLREVHVAAWDEMRVEVLSEYAAVLTATVRWSSTDTADVRTDLAGVWTAVWVRGPGGWRICSRHESFTTAT